MGSRTEIIGDLVEHVSCIHKALGLVASVATNKKQNQANENS